MQGKSQNVALALVATVFGVKELRISGTIDSLEMRYARRRENMVRKSYHRALIMERVWVHTFVS